MNERNTISRKKVSSENDKKIKKLSIYKEASIDAIREASKFDTAIIQSNDEYLKILLEADKTEYDLLKLNMEKAESEAERKAIRDRMAEMKKERYEKDSENKTFYERQQENHKNYILKILGSVAVMAGLVKFRKPIKDLSKKLITKH